MARRCIGIDLAGTYLRAVQLVRTGNRVLIEKTFSTQTRRSTDSLPDLLASLRHEHGFGRRADIAVSLPASETFFREIEVDAATAEDLRKGNASALENAFPIAIEDLIVRVCSARHAPGGNYRLLIAATSARSLRERTQTLGAAKMPAKFVTAPILTICSAVIAGADKEQADPMIVAHIGRSHLQLAVVKGPDILAVRNIPVEPWDDGAPHAACEKLAAAMAHEAQITWNKLFDKAIDDHCRLHLAGPDGLCERLEPLLDQKLGCRTVKVTLAPQIETPSRQDLDPVLISAASLALSGLDGKDAPSMDFLDAYRAGLTAAFSIRKELAVAALLVAAIAGAWAIGLFAQLSGLERDYADIKRRTNQLFRRTLPEERIVNPLAQLQEKIDSFKNDAGMFGSVGLRTSSPLDILHDISKMAPAAPTLSVDDLLITTESVRLVGRCGSFDVFNKWQRDIRGIPGFSITDVPDARKEPKTGIVHFTIVLSREG